MQKGSLNKVLIIGHLGADPDSRFTPSGDAVSNFNVATTFSWRTANGENKEKTEWHKVVVFRKLAEVANEYLKKGQLVYIEGRLQTRDWEDKEGVKRYTTEIICDNFTMLGRKRNGDSGSVPDVDTQADDDLPF
jgi:single-strand DNA-binding protein